MLYTNRINIMRYQIEVKNKMIGSIRFCHFYYLLLLPLLINFCHFYYLLLFPLQLFMHFCYLASIFFHLFCCFLLLFSVHFMQLLQLFIVQLLNLSNYGESYSTCMKDWWALSFKITISPNSAIRAFQQSPLQVIWLLMRSFSCVLILINNIFSHHCYCH